LQNIIPNTIYRLQNSTQANHKKGMAMWLDYMFSGSQARGYILGLPPDYGLVSNGVLRGMITD
jgi:hypothetical protein